MTTKPARKKTTVTEHDVVAIARNVKRELQHEPTVDGDGVVARALAKAGFPHLIGEAVTDDDEPLTLPGP